MHVVGNNISCVLPLTPANNFEIQFVCLFQYKYSCKKQNTGLKSPAPGRLRSSPVELLPMLALMDQHQPLLQQQTMHRRRICALCMEDRDVMKKDRHSKVSQKKSVFQYPGGNPIYKHIYNNIQTYTTVQSLVLKQRQSQVLSPSQVYLMKLIESLWKLPHQRTHTLLRQSFSAQKQKSLNRE